MVLRRWQLVGLLALGVSWARSAYGMELLPGAKLELTTAPGLEDCVVASQLVDRVRAEYRPPGGGDTELAPNADRLALLVTVEQTSAGLVALVEASGRRSGERQLQAATCAGLLDALVVTLSLTLDEDAQVPARHERENVTPPITPGPPPEAPPASALPSKPVVMTASPQPATGARAIARLRSSRRRFELRSSVSAGVSSEPALGLLTGAELGRGHLNLVVAGAAVIGAAQAVRVETSPLASEPATPAISTPASPPASRLAPAPSGAPSVELVPEIPPARDTAQGRTRPAPGVLAEPVDALREESRQLAQARRRLRAGDPGAALQILADARARFPRGTLYQERDALEIEALAGVGRRSEAAARARSFLDEHPRSAHAARVRAALEPPPR